MAFQVGDALALAKLAVDIYQNVFLVAKAAPETFTKLLRELIIVKNVLYKLDRRFQQANRHYFDEATSGALAGCQEALLTFRPLVIKYKNLASANGSQLRQKLKFPFDQKKIHTAREELQKSIATLNLALAADATTFEAVGDPLPPRQPRRSTQHHVERVDDDAPSSPGQATAAKLLHGPPERSSNAQELPWRLGRAETIDTTTAERIGIRRREDTVTSVAETHLAPVAQESRHANSRHSTDSLRSHRTKSSFASVGSVPVTTPLTTVPASPRSGESLFPKDYDISHEHATTAESDRHSIDESEERVPIDTEFRTEITERLQENPLYKRLSSVFTKEAQSLKEQNNDLGKWLSCAMWWLLKARKTNSAIHSSPTSLEQRRTHWPHRISLEQATVDMFKACWICKEIVFDPTATSSAVLSSTWKAAKDLAAALYDELHFYDLLQGLQPNANLERLYTSFNEKPHQPIENLERLPAALDSLRDATTWLTVDVDHAGDLGERVLFRTFVNAQIGTDPRTRRKSGSAPYMLLLWSQHGRSEVLVSLANQLGTVNLGCTLTEHDLRRHEEHTRSSLEFELSFPSQDCVIQFMSPQELQDFLKQPREFFQATRPRESKPEEFLCFRDGLQAFSERAHRARTSIGGNAPHAEAHSTCEVSLYQHIPDQCWKTQRRLVVSSALDATHPWCRSYWLPLSHVRVQGDGRDVELHWSDCNQLEKRPDGNYGFYYSLVYNPSAANVNVSLQFQSPASANEFKAAVLRPWNIPFESEFLECKGVFGAAGGPDDSPTSAPLGQELSIWRLMDAHDAGKMMYLSIVHVERKPQLGFETSVYFVHRDVDFLIEGAGQRSVSFEGLWIPRYLSSVNEIKAPPKATGVCEDVEWALSSADFFFEPEDITRFISALIGWELVFCYRANSMVIGAGIKATRQNNLIVSLWKRPSDSTANRDLKVTARWMGEVRSKNEHKWTSAAISTTSVSTTNSTKLLIKDTELTRGSQLDIKFLTAVDVRGRFDTQHRRALTINFSDPGATQRMNTLISQILHPDMSNQDAVLWRPMTYATDTSASQMSSNDASKFLHRI